MANTPFIKRLETLAEKHRSIVAAAETLLRLVRGAAGGDDELPAGLGAAIALDAARRGRRKMGRPKGSKNRPKQTKVAAQAAHHTNGSGRFVSTRERKIQATKKRLARYSTTEPRHGTLGAPVLTHHGYLKRLPDGRYLRTDKPYGTSSAPGAQ